MEDKVNNSRMVEEAEERWYKVNGYVIGRGGRSKKTKVYVKARSMGGVYERYFDSPEIDKRKEGVKIGNPDDNTLSRLKAFAGSRNVIPDNELFKFEE